MSLPTSIPELATPLLQLRPFESRDAPIVQELCSEKDIAATTEYIPHPYPEGAAEEWLATHATQAAEGNALIWAIVPVEFEQVVGAIGLTLSGEHQRASLGYWVGRPYWGKGFATAALQRVLQYSFGELGLRRVEACCFMNNPASARVMEKCGMTVEGVFRKHFVKWGEALDVSHHAILESEFIAD